MKKLNLFYNIYILQKINFGILYIDFNIVFRN